jgi:DNA repair and recombination protein RAD52
MSITEEQSRKLNENLPREVVEQRDGGGGRKLSYVPGFYVVDRLNLIFGCGGWSYACTTREVVRERTEDDQKSGAKVWRWHVSYSASCTLTVGGCTITDVGHGHGVDKDCGAAIESAEKEAATDALKRCAKSLGRSMGLALYDKSQEHVGPTVGSVVDAIKAAHDTETFGRAIADYRAIAGKLTKAEEALITEAGKDARERLGLTKQATKKEG